MPDSKSTVKTVPKSVRPDKNQIDPSVRMHLEVNAKKHTGVVAHETGLGLRGMTADIKASKVVKDDDSHLQLPLPLKD